MSVEKKLADEIVALNGKYGDDPQIMRIVEYDNAWGGIGYGLEYKRDLGKYSPSEFVINPRVYWSWKP